MNKFPKRTDQPWLSVEVKKNGMRVDRAASADGLEVQHGRQGQAEEQPLGPWAPEVVDLAGPQVRPRPPVAEFYIPDLVLDAWETSQLTLRLASVRGSGHRFGQAPRQDDAVAIHHAATGAVVIAVADGVGAAPQSHHGSRTAVRKAARVILRNLDGGDTIDWLTVFDRVTDVLERLAEERGAVPGDAAALLGTTLLVAVIRPVQDGLQADLAWAGDSGSWVLDQQGAFHPMIRAKTADSVTVVSSAVRALPQRPAAWDTCSVTLGPGQVLLLGTDGFGDPLGDGTGLVGDLFSRFLSAPPQPLRFAHLVDFSRETFDDDRTLVAVWPKIPEQQQNQSIDTVDLRGNGRSEGQDSQENDRPASSARRLAEASMNVLHGRHRR